MADTDNFSVSSFALALAQANYEDALWSQTKGMMKWAIGFTSLGHLYYSFPLGVQDLDNPEVDMSVASLASLALFETNPSAGSGAVNFMAEEDQLLNAANRSVIDPEGVLDIVAQGDANGIYLGENYLSAAEAANAISADSQFTGQNVRLLSCSTGSCSTGFAQQLSNSLRVSVTAPSDSLWAFPSGRLTIGPTPVSNTGWWVTFTPK